MVEEIIDAWWNFRVVPRFVGDVEKLGPAQQARRDLVDVAQEPWSAD